jgi:hypothetical protein
MSTKIESEGKNREPEHTGAKSLTHSRGWEFLFFFSEAIMIVFYCVGTTYTHGGHSWDTDPVIIAA